MLKVVIIVYVYFGWLSNFLNKVCLGYSELCNSYRNVFWNSGLFDDFVCNGSWCIIDWVLWG